MSTPKPSTRWRVLVAFVLVAMVTQLLWLNFAPMLVDLEKRYGVSDLVASLLVLPFPALYVLLSIPSGRLIDRLGYRRVVGWGAVISAVGSLIRLDTAHFAALLAGQFVIAIGQPFVVNGINKLVADWFEEDEVAIATGLGTVGMFLGMALGMATTPGLASSIGLRGAMVVNALAAIGAAVAWYVLCVERGVAEEEQPSPFGSLLRNRQLMLFVVLGLLGLGFFNGLTTWLEQLLEPRGLDAQQSGLVGGAIILGGILGAIVIPALADWAHARRLPLIACVGAATATNLWLTAAWSYRGLLASGALMGFFFMPAFALLLAMTGEVVDRRDIGAATGLLMLAGNGGGVLVILAMQGIGGWKGHGPWARLVGLTVITFALSLGAPETFKESEVTPG